MESRQSPKIWQLMAGTTTVGVLAFIWAKAYQHFWLLVDYKPLKIPQKYWSKKQTWKSVPMAMVLFLLNHGLWSWTQSTSDDLMEYKKIKEEQKRRKEIREGIVHPPPLYPEEQFEQEKRYEHVIPGFFIKKLSKKYGWHKEDAKTLPFLSFLQLSRIPVYFFALQLAPFALVPSLLPWNTNTYCPPGWQLSLVAWFRYFEEVLGYNPSLVEPTPREILSVFEHDASESIKTLDSLSRLFGK